MNMRPSPESSLSPEAKAQQELNRFLYNPALDDLANLFGVSELPVGEQDRLEALQAVAAEHWDARKGEERQVVNWDNELLDQEGSELWTVIFEAADKLGLVQDSAPVNTKPDSLVILGGANKAPLDRLRYGIENTEDFGQVAYLGSSRAIKTDAEKLKTADYAPGAETEYDLGSAAFETMLGAKLVDEINQERGGDIWGMRLYEFVHNGIQKHGFVLSTPQKIGARRATTTDNYRFFADRAELSTDPNHSVVAVTTGFYTAAQHLPAVRELTLKYGTSLETIGHSAEYSGVKRKPSQLLQENKAAIDAAMKLHLALKGHEV